MRFAFISMIFLCSAARAADSSPASCRQTSGSVDCSKVSQCVNDRFAKVLYKDPKKRDERRNPESECENNNAAGWDRNTAAEFNRNNPDVRATEGTPDRTVCRATFTRLLQAVDEYREALETQCRSQANVGNCSSGDQKEFYLCTARHYREAASASAKAREAMQRAVTEAAEYKRLTLKVKQRYIADIDKVRNTERALITAGRDPNDIRQLKDSNGVITGTEFTATQPSLLATLQADVDARNGGASTISGYQARRDRLTAEQDAAATTVNEFTRVAREVEIPARREAEQTFLRDATRAEQYAARGGPPSTTTPARQDPSSTISSNTTKEKGLLDGLNPSTLAALGTAATGLAGAVNRANQAGATAASQPYTPGLNQGTSPTPDSANHKGTDTSPFSAGGNDPGHTVNATPDPAGSKGDFSRPGQISSGPGFSGRFGGSGSENGSADLSGRTPSSAATGTAAAGGSGSFGIKDSGRKLGSAPEEKACAGGGDCNAMEDLKTAQFNAGGALGIPKIGAADPALATKGALDNLFGPLPGLEPFGKPTDPSAIPGLPGGPAGSFAGFEGPGGEAALPVRASAEDVQGINSRSLFLRVHGAHENAQKRGTVSLFHKRL